jgi:8-oxo-dGTP pyrophosphatase MutT (NUDIX family)
MDFAAFTAAIARLSPISDREGSYDHAPVRVRTYLADVAWPDALVSSVRAVVFRGRRVVAVRHRDGRRHIIPGGRREPGESIDEAVRREILEESGWRAGALIPLGFERVEHLGPPAAGFPFPSGFINPLFVAEAVSYHRAARDLTQSEAGASLVSTAWALRELPPWQAALLRAAVARRSWSP